MQTASLKEAYKTADGGPKQYESKSLLSENPEAVH
jgi:hypothetical protein